MNTREKFNSTQTMIALLHSEGYRLCEVYDAYEVAYRLTPTLKEQYLIIKSMIDAE